MTIGDSVELERPEDQLFWENVPSKLNDDVVQTLIVMCHKSPAREICGFITSQGVILPIENIADGSSEFEMDRNRWHEILTSDGVRVVGIYHSHPSGRPWPSTYDTQHFGYLYRQGCQWDYYIVTNGGVFQYEHRDRQQLEEGV